jgi:hypothetical protein
MIEGRAGARYDKDNVYNYPSLKIGGDPT